MLPVGLVIMKQQAYDVGMLGTLVFLYFTTVIMFSILLKYVPSVATLSTTYFMVWLTFSGYISPEILKQASAR